MALASHQTYPSGGRLGRRPSKSWARLLISSATAVAVAAALVGLVAFGAHRTKMAQKSAGARIATIAPRIAIPESASAAAPKRTISASAATPAAPAVPKVDFGAVASDALAGSSQTQAAARTPSSAEAAQAPGSSPSPAPAPPATAERQQAPDLFASPVADGGSQADSGAQTDVSESIDAAEPPPAQTAARDAGIARQSTTARSVALSNKAGSSTSARSYAVYLSGGLSQAEARAQLAPMQRKLAAALHGRRLNYHRIRQNGSFVYRLRLGRLDQAAAQSFCRTVAGGSATCDVEAE